ncbi:HAD family hydrolase [Corynebacterium sp. Marseille-P4321]|uniref:HAD family hydrolase n=1 Tax=Corynebacterium sp. Marseille-P4321 TaxID=2736603 RepID=UPI00158A0F40|nr:HAD family hydrolase [Corynebacterium sp. Marseille-P4321]
MKVAAFDFDGTLHHPGAGINPSDIAAIDAWRNAGHLAISATGRSRSALAYALRGSGLEFDYQVLSNGGSATDGANTELIYGYEVDAAVLHAALDAFGEREGLAIFGTTLGRVDGVFANNTGAAHTFTAHFEPMTRADIPAHRFAVVPIWVPGNEALRAEVVEWAHTLDGVTVAQNQDYIDLMAPGRNKGAGVEELLAGVGVEPDQLITFGDSWNDLTMHEIATVSHSFRHSPPEVQDATDRVIGAVHEVLAGYL